MTTKPARGEMLARIRETCVGENPEIVERGSYVVAHPTEHYVWQDAPIRLADVLLAVAWVREVPVPLYDQRVLSVCSYWDMRNDSLEEQDGRTVGLIFNLLGDVAARAEKTDQA